LVGFADGVDDLDELAGDVADGGGVVLLLFDSVPMIDGGEERMTQADHAGGLEECGAQGGAPFPAKRDSCSGRISASWPIRTRPA
jgi:hypothetical protein